MEMGQKPARQLPTQAGAWSQQVWLSQVCCQAEDLATAWLKAVLHSPQYCDMTDQRRQWPGQRERKNYEVHQGMGTLST